MPIQLWSCNCSFLDYNVTLSFFSSPALHQPYVPSPLHTEHHKFRHTRLYTNMLSKISWRTRLTSVFLFSLSQADCGFCHQTPGVFSSALFWYWTVGTLLGRYWSMKSLLLLTAKCKAGFFPCQGLKFFTLHWSVAWRRCKGIRLLLLSRRRWRQAESDS